MILILFTVNSPKQAKLFPAFKKIAKERYSGYLAQEFAPYNKFSWFTAVKPYDSGVFPFLALDAMIHFRGGSCRFFFGHDLLPFGTMTREEMELDETVQREVDSILSRESGHQSRMEFHGFGTRIDVGLNALGVLFMDMLDSLTKVETHVLSELRTLQFEKYGDPTMVKTFGLQKRVAERLDKSPVAVHKSLRSSKFPLLADTALAIKGMML